MTESIQTITALEVLMHDAHKISQLIISQRKHMCLAQCPAFEEIIDTQMFGFSKEVDYAVKIGVIGEEEGHRILSDLEKSLNSIYTEMYEEEKNK